MLENIEYISWIGILSALISMLALNLVVRCRKTVKNGTYQTNAYYSTITNDNKVPNRQIKQDQLNTDQLLHTLRMVILVTAIFEQSESIQNWINANPRLKFKLEQAQQAILDEDNPDQVIQDFSTHMIQTLQQVRPPPFYEELLGLLGEYTKSCN